jgi:hypothetical protein
MKKKKDNKKKKKDRKKEFKKILDDYKIQILKHTDNI